MYKSIRTMLAAAVGAGFLAASGAAHALVMDFGTGSTTTTSTSPFVQNGLTMTPLDTGVASVVNHWDIYGTAPFGSLADNAAALHTGNNGEEVRFTYSGGAFDLLSVFVEGFLFDGDGDNNGAGLTATFTASSGATHMVSDPFSGIIDFSALSGWSNITWFEIGVPLGVGACSVAGNDCSNFGFDDVTFREHVAGTTQLPAPGALAIFGLGLAGLGLARRQRRG